MTYQKRDAHIIDYHIYKLQGIELRGPRIDLKKSYIACVGAAQTFGPFCKKPFPLLLAEKSGVQTLNLGLGGAIPSQFINRTLLKATNRSSLAIVQVLSGRCGSNSRYTTIANQVGIKHDDNTISPPASFWQYAEKKYSKRLLDELVEETRRDYLYKMMILLQLIKVKKILFYISTKKPDDLPDRMTRSPFPHFLRQYMIDKLAEFCDEYVEFVSSEGLPQRLYDKKGNPTTVKTTPWSKKKSTTHNVYYPSPEMHKGAARVLEPVCRKLLEI